MLDISIPTMVGDSKRNSRPNPTESVTTARFQGTNGGYTRIIKIPPRKGDCAPMAAISLIPGITDKAAVKEKSKKK